METNISIREYNKKIIDSLSFEEFDPIKELKDTKNFSMTITSKRRTGKSVFMKDVCYKIKDWYSEVFVFSLTAEYQHSLFDYIPEENVFNSFDEDKLNKIWECQKQKIMKLEKAGVDKTKMPYVMILMDDLISDIRVRKSEILNRFFVAGRHINLACIFITQYFTSIPPVIRTNVDFAVCFYIESYDSRDAFSRQYLSTENNKLGMLIFDKLTKEHYQSLIVCCTKIDRDPSKYLRTYVADLKVPPFMMGKKSVMGSKITKNVKFEPINLPRFKQED